jgi:hypothetical protein
MNVLWIIVGLGVLAAIARTIAWSHERREADLGFVSHHWVAEHRMAQAQDPQR